MDAITLLLQNGRIIDPANNCDQTGDLLIVDGLITQTAPPGTLTCPDNGKTFDLQGKWIVPGLIDMHVHLREPGEEYK